MLSGGLIAAVGIVAPSGKCLSPYADRVEMLLPEQAEGIAWPIDNQSKQVENVPAEDAHVEGFWVDETGKLASEYRLASIILSEADLRLDNNRFSNSTDPAQLIRTVGGLKMKSIQHIGADAHRCGMSFPWEYNR
jgi:hypothetical protein